MSCFAGSNQDDCGGLRFRNFTAMKKGELMCKMHGHNFPHALIVFKGAVRLIWIEEGEEKSEVVDAPGRRGVPAHVPHTLMSEKDDTDASCVFAHRDDNADVVYEPTEIKKAYV